MTRVVVYYTGRFNQTGIDAAAGMVGGDVTSVVDYANADGTGVACLDVPADELTRLGELLTDLPGVESRRGIPA